MAPTDYRFDPDRATPYFFQPGKVVVKGALTNRPSDSNERLLSIVKFNNTIRQDKTMSELVPINRDGTFQAEFEVAHPQYVVLQSPVDGMVFVVPGDTVVLCYDCVRQGSSEFSGYVPAVLGNSLSAQLTRHSLPCIRAASKLPGLEGLRRYDVSDMQSDSAAYSFADRTAELLPVIFEQVPGMLATYPLSPIAKDIIVTNIASNAFEDIMTLKLYRAGKVSVPRYFSFLKDVRLHDNLLDNDYLFCSFHNFLVFNRFGFEVFHPYYYEFHREYIDNVFMHRPELKGADATPDAARRLCSGPHYTGEHNPGTVELASAIGYDSIPTAGFVYRNAYDRIKDVLGIGNCMLMQRSIFEVGLLCENEIDVAIENLTGAMPFITNPVIAVNALKYLRGQIAEREGGAGTKEMSPAVKEFINSLNAKYPGEHVVLDFWGLGCAPCCSSILDQRELVDKYAGKIRFVYVCDEPSNPAAKVEEFFTTNNIKGESLRVDTDLWHTLKYDFGFSGIPHIEILLKDGTMYKKEGRIYLNEDFIDKELLQNE